MPLETRRTQTNTRPFKVSAFYHTAYFSSCIQIHYLQQSTTLKFPYVFLRIEFHFVLFI